MEQRFGAWGISRDRTQAWSLFTSVSLSRILHEVGHYLCSSLYPCCQEQELAPGSCYSIFKKNKYKYKNELLWGLRESVALDFCAGVGGDSIKKKLEVGRKRCFGARWGVDCKTWGILPQLDTFIWESRARRGGSWWLAVVLVVREGILEKVVQQNL